MKMYLTGAAITAMGLLATSVSAQNQAVLKGQDAFGNWEQNQPGTVRMLGIADSPAPTPEESASNGPGTVPMPDGAMPKVEDGFQIEMVASGIANPRAIRFAPNGDLFVANSDPGEVLVLSFDKTSGKAEQTVFASGLNQPYGIAFYPANDPKWVYIGESSGLKRFPYKAGDRKASGQPETLFDNIPPEHHWTRDVVFLNDQTLLYAVGSGSNVGDGTMEDEPTGGLDAWISAHPLGVSWGQEERRAAVLAYDPEGKNETYYATGLRNCSGLAIQPATGEPWCVVNNVDLLGDNVPFDYATHVEKGAFYGWPWYYLSGLADPRWAQTPRQDLADKVTAPDVLFQAHSAPLNIVFYDSDAFGSDYKGDAFVTMHGSWNRGKRTGYKIVRLDFDKDKPVGSYEDFVTGFVVDADNVWGRPVGIAVSQSGDLYFSEDGSGTIWRVSKK
jgi:glucose/arabinose dehydrogenase